MSDHAATVRRFWEVTEARDRQAPGALLAPDFAYACQPPPGRAHLTERS
jgi:hypothetical protein